MSDSQTLPRTKAPRLGELLVSNGLVTPEQLKFALSAQTGSGRRLGETLIEMGLVDERLLCEVLGEQLGLRAVDLRQKRPEAAVADSLPESLIRSLVVIPLRRSEDGVLEVVSADPSDPSVRDGVERAAGAQVRFLLAPASDIRQTINATYRAIHAIERFVEVYEAKQGDVRLDGEDSPVERIVSLLLTQAGRDGASDIHIEPQEDAVRVRFRLDGTLHTVLTLPRSLGLSIVSRIKVMAGMNIVERRRSQDGQLRASVDGELLDVRVATTATLFGEKAVLRLQDVTRRPRSIDDLGMEGEAHASFEKLARSPHGMILVAGPTGSGKTSTLYAVLGELDSDASNITTIEDPVEFVVPTINQIQINEAAGTTFASGLRAILRQDPDIILVGEIRDVETARVAVQAALTGHVVLSSLHATDAPGALYRFVDMGIEPFLVASSVRAVVSQRLVRRICDGCREEQPVGNVEASAYASLVGEAVRHSWVGTGCNLCGGTGYLGRQGIFELLTVDDAVRAALLRDAPVGEIRRVASEAGMRSLAREALRLVEAGTTTISEALRVVGSV